MNQRIVHPIAFLLTLSSLLTSCGQTQPDYTSALTWHDDFSVLQLTDIHWSTETQRAHQKEYLRAVVNAAAKTSPTKKIDLIMITGDAILIGNKTILDDLYSFIQSLDIPYGVTWGNHDKQGTYSLSYMYSMVKKGQSVFKNPQDDVMGDSNYVVNLMDGNKVAWKIFALDSNSYLPASNPLKYQYDYIHDDQVNLFKSLAETDKAPSLVYFHIPPKDWATAITDQSASITKKKWEMNEKFSVSTVDSGFMAAAATENVKGVFFGHDHSNDLTATYNGIVTGYGVKSGKELYYSHSTTRDIDIIGGSLSILHADGTFDLDHVYVQDDATFSATVEAY
jgi:hypothetical protein